MKIKKIYIYYDLGAQRVIAYFYDGSKRVSIFLDA